jgi:HK97 family phage portal protein
MSFIRKAAVEFTTFPSMVLSNVTWPQRGFESFTGAWQRNMGAPDPQTSILAFSAVFSCVTGIAGDVAKMRIKLTQDVNGICEEITEKQPWLSVLRKPNRYQNRIQFVSDWIVSKLLFGNAYILKERDGRGVVNALYVLNPLLVTPLVAEDGSVYYRLGRDFLAGVTEDNLGEDNPTVPASEIIHDRMCCLWHPLVGVSPIYACGVTATMGNRIQANSTNAFSNGSRPGGVLEAPGKISDETAARLKKAFEENFSGVNVGRLAVLGDGLKFTPMTMSAESSQLIEQLKWTVDDVARCFHYPPWKLGGAMPVRTGPNELATMYYTDCLQTLIESLELCLDEGLALPLGMGTELDLDNLMRMDTAALFTTNSEGVGGGWMAPDEARYRANLPPVPGGSSPMIQQQNYSLAALAKRDAQADPFASRNPAAPAPAPGSPPALPAPSSPPALPSKSMAPETIDLFARAFLWKELSAA